MSFYNYDFNTEMPADIVAIENKADGSRTPADRAKLVAHYVSDTKLLRTVPLDAGQFALRWRRDGSGVAAAGEDDKVRIISAADAQIVKEFVPVPLAPAPATADR